ncbi:DUF6562 domain-containing protein [Parabacteroides chinchillae]|uniref:DUF6562 domain-containing protein n=1 Tax=Parabacteroides chinchillae TaxID=871327 RepID=A0A8G2BWH8_9BACT|nr:DUF6562 domain-containing protein [Parabacteroides chinchillae]SEF89149.1 hypothetical protein SAMN05444001_1094 [Parabacteroides chinchillae]
MKKYHLYLWIIALVGLITSCSQDETDALQTATESNRVTLTASLPEDFAQIGTRALPTAPSDYKLRCILEVWTQGAPDQTPVLKQRIEQAGMTGDNVVFDFTIDEGKYYCLFWADFIATDSKGISATIGGLSCTHYDDKFYATNDVTNGLKAISIIENVYAFNTDARDAFCGLYALEKGATAVTNPTIPALTRPFAKLTIKEKNATNYGYCSGLQARYTVPKNFNVLSGIASGTVTVTCNSKSAESQTLFSDYIFTEASSTLGSIDLTFTGTEGKDLQSVTIPAGIPLKRNYKTNATGSLISEKPVSIKDVKLTVDINSDWTTSDVEYNTDVAPARNILDPVKTAGSGDKAEDYHYTIATAEQLAALSTLAKANAVITGSTEAMYRNANYVLDANIDLENKPWTPIYNFYGTFDGQGNTISNMNVSINSTDENYEARGGLFEAIGGKVSNLIVEGAVTVTGAKHCFAGGICGLVAGTIEFCRFNGTVSSTTSNNNAANAAGGITGSYAGNTLAITGCIANAQVTISGGKAESSGAGGLAGDINGRNCSYSAWNSGSSGGTTDMIGKNNNSDGAVGTGNNNFTDISTLNSQLNGINNGVSESTYKWQTGDSGTAYPKLVPRTPVIN